MALHGDVSINGSELIVWSARRLSPNIRDINEYEVEVFEHATNETTRFKLKHTYKDGAAVLASAVLRTFNYKKAGV